MKYLSILLSAVSIALAVWLYNSLGLRQEDLKQHENDISQVASFSNQLIFAQGQVVGRDATLVTMSNRLDESWTAWSSLSNQLETAQATAVSDRARIAELKRSIAEAGVENQELNRYIGELTNQMAGLAWRIQAADTNLAHMSKEYFLLENRLLRDVAERVMVERSFSNYTVLQVQMRKLKTNAPAPPVTPRDIFAGLNVEVNANGDAHVISPDMPPEPSGKL